MVTTETVVLAVAIAVILGLSLSALVDMQRRRGRFAGGSGRYPWHSEAGSVYHVCPRCEPGSGADPSSLRIGTGDLPLCQRCAQLQEGGEC